MNWKEFFKPDLEKVVIWILWSVLLFSAIKLVSSDIPLVFSLSGWLLVISGWLIFYPYFIVNVIFLYLLSCLIIWIYDKAKKK